jgi:hypothetical protein
MNEVSPSQLTDSPAPPADLSAPAVSVPPSAPATPSVSVARAPREISFPRVRWWMPAGVLLAVWCILIVDTLSPSSPGEGPVSLLRLMGTAGTCPIS